MKPEEFDKIFDDGEQDMTPHLDVSTTRRPNREVQRVNVDFPKWMVNSLDRESRRLGVTRQSLIKMWIGDKLEERKAHAAGDASSAAES